MTTFVLVHGAFGGSYGWHLVTPLLRAAGHEVYTPSLTGLGERSHLASPEVDLTTHVTDLKNALFYQDYRDVVLVGHSYGGMVITGVLESSADRIAHLVYLDAMVPADGQSVEDINGRPATTDGYLVPPIPRPMPDKAEEAWMGARRHGHPVGTMQEKVRLPQPLEQYPFSLTYIKASADERENAQETRSNFWRTADRLKENPRWRYREIATSHMAQNEKPFELASMLLELVS